MIDDTIVLWASYAHGIRRDTALQFFNALNGQDYFPEIMESFEYGHTPMIRNQIDFQSTWRTAYIIMDFVNYEFQHTYPIPIDVLHKALTRPWDLTQIANEIMYSLIESNNFLIKFAEAQIYAKLIFEVREQVLYPNAALELEYPTGIMLPFDIDPDEKPTTFYAARSAFIIKLSR